MNKSGHREVDVYVHGLPVARIATRVWQLAAAATLCGACEAPPEPETESVALALTCTGSPDGSYSCTLPGQQPTVEDWWQDTGLDVVGGSAFAIECTGGVIRPWGGHAGFTCAGQSPTLLWDLGIATQCTFGSLVGRIGATGAPFCIGAAGFAVPPATGRLYIGFNDGVNFNDNSGSWQLSITPPAICIPGLTSCLCGNGMFNTGEQCDDGNHTNGDGCSATCQLELATCGKLVDLIGRPLAELTSFAPDGPGNTCSAHLSNGTSVDATPLVMQAMMNPGGGSASLSLQWVAACAVLEEARQICQTGTYQQASEPLISRTRLCHANMELNCTRDPATFAQILNPVGFPGTHPSSTVGHSYCSGQVSGNVGYSLEVPQQRISWTCNQSQADAVLAIVADAKNKGYRLLGVSPFNWPGSGTCENGQAGSSTCNVCRISRALFECVMPALGAATPSGGSACVVSGADPSDRDGSKYPVTGDYCYRILQFRGGDGAHHDGRAIDINPYAPPQAPKNNGNLFVANRVAAMNVFLTAQLDLPPRFVSIMKACGFEWGGHWLAVETETSGLLQMACDPMHFQFDDL